jgi:hypothetical protein
MSAHYYIERNSANNNLLQLDSQKYGPVKNLENTQYRTTSLFEIAQDTKAFAVTTGKILIYDNDADPTELVNIVLMPNGSEKYPKRLTPGIKFYVYRGLRRSDFIVNVNGTDELNSTFKNLFASSYPTLTLSDVYVSGSGSAIQNRMNSNGIYVGKGFELGSYKYYSQPPNNFLPGFELVLDTLQYHSNLVIDHSQLPTQASADTFAPDSSDPTNKFNITSRFQLTGQTKAFACQKSLMIVQQSSVDSSLVNVILKPIEGLKIPFKSVKYFVYRGLLKNSFISGTAITPQATTNAEFIARFWTNWNDYKTNTNQPNLTDPTPQSFGHDISLAGSLEIENIYDNSQTDVRAILVQEGEWIGDFGSAFKIGFEIITEADNITLDLDFLRAEKNQIDVTGLSGLALRAEREKILSFIDPAAFFGLHYETGVSISTYSGTNKTTEKKKQNDIYTFLLDNKFATRNTVYLDIRSERGLSYNFYQNYDDGSGNNIKIGNSTTTPTEQSYSMNEWPIIFINTPLTTADENNDIKINLRIDDNTKPILFFQNTNFLGNNNQSRFLRENDVLNGSAVDWSKDLTFKFPNTGAGSSKENVAYYINLYYFRQEHNLSSPSTVLKNETYFDSAFCSVDLSNLADTNFLFQQVYNPDLIYLRGQFPGETAEFGYIADCGGIWDDTRVVFYYQENFQNKN